MSAFVVDPEHIDALVQVAAYGPAGTTVRPDKSWYAPQWTAGEDFRSQRRTVSKLPRENAADVASREEYFLDDLGAVLIGENVASVSHRYRGSDSLPGRTDAWWTRPYIWRRPRVTPTAIEALKLIDCYEYQSCEHDAWHTSEARRFCEALRGTLIHHLAGYDEAPWGWNDTPKRRTA